jgi:hypothetical protein
MSSSFHEGLEVSGAVDDQRGVDVIVAEEVAYLADGGGRGCFFAIVSIASATAHTTSSISSD